MFNFLKTSQKMDYPHTVDVGDVIAVHIKTKDNEKFRSQVFHGICIAKKGKGYTRTFTVRRVDFKGRVERIFPMFSPIIQKIITKNKSKIRRAKLYYVRSLFGKKAKIKKLHNFKYKN